jgi:IMP dehydrogenase
MDIFNSYTFADVLIKPKYSEVLSRSKVDTSTVIAGIPIRIPVISANMKTITGTKMSRTMLGSGAWSILHRFNTIDEAVCEYEKVGYNWVGVSIGVQEEDKKRFQKLYDAGARIFCIDVAHGHHILVKNMISWIRNNTSSTPVTIIAGNVGTGDGAYDLVEWGADIVKVGIGPGSVCQTRQRTGVGVPQLHALEDVWRVLKLHGKKAGIIADGGITTVGDIAKALKFADIVMIGSMIAGTSETPGNVFRDPNGKFYKVYGGSASAENKGGNKFVEGMMKTVPFIGKVKYILREIEDGLKSSFSYVGANNLKEFQQLCEFQPISNNSAIESKLT